MPFPQFDLKFPTTSGLWLLPDFFIANVPARFSMGQSFSDTIAMIVLTSCLRATYASGHFLSGLLNILLNLPALCRLGRGIPAVHEKLTETPSGCGLRSARAAGATSAPLPFHLRGKHPQRDERAPWSTSTRTIDRFNELKPIQFGSPSPPPWRSLTRDFLASAFGRQLQNHPRAAQTGRPVG